MNILVSLTGLLTLLCILIGPYIWGRYIHQTSSQGAPYVPLEPEIVQKILAYLELKPGETFYDLGSGDGRIVIGAATLGANAFGVEIDPLRVWYSRLWIAALMLGKKAHIIQKDFFSVDLSDADAVSLYLLPMTNDVLTNKLDKELKPDARVISVAFTLPGNWELVDFDPKGTEYGPIYLYSHGKKSQASVATAQGQS